MYMLPHQYCINHMSKECSCTRTNRRLSLSQHIYGIEEHLVMWNKVF